MRKFIGGEVSPPAPKKSDSPRRQNRNAGVPFEAQLLLACFLLLSTTAGAAAPAFVEATSERDDGKPQSSMWNAVDGNEGTVWCTKPMMNGGKEALNFAFDAPVEVTHLEIVLHKGKEPGTVDKSIKRPRIVFVADVEHRVEAKFKDVSDQQVLELTPPAKGMRVVVEFEDPYPGEADDAPLCVAEVVLKSHGKDVTSELGAKVRGVNTGARKLLHQWHDDISAPSRTLVFNVDGTFTYRFESLLDDSKPVRLKGRWTAAGTTLSLETGGKPYKLEMRFTRVDSGEGNVEMLTLSGAAPHESMIEDFKPAPLLLP